MTARTVSNLPAAATHDVAARCLLAIELSKKSWVVAVTTPLADKISRHRLKGFDWKGLVELIKRLRTRIGNELGRPVEVISCYEAGYDGFWLHRLLEADGVRNFVIDPASLQVDRWARRAKTDRIDAERLLRSPLAHLRGEPKVWSVVHVPSIAEEDARRLHRERDRLIDERNQHVNRIKGLCAIDGIYHYNPVRSDRLERLERLRTVHGHGLPPALKAELKRELQRLELVLQAIATVEAERDAILTDKEPVHLNARTIRDLNKLRAIGAAMEMGPVPLELYPRNAASLAIVSRVGCALKPYAFRRTASRPLDRAADPREGATNRKSHGLSLDSRSLILAQCSGRVGRGLA
jgi:transposase